MKRRERDKKEKKMIDLNEASIDVESVNISVELGAPFLKTAYDQHDIHWEEGVGKSLDTDIGSNTAHVPTTHVATPRPLLVVWTSSSFPSFPASPSVLPAILLLFRAIL